MAKKRVIKLNALKCLVCDEIIMSVYTKETVKCGCTNEAWVSGGYEYFMRGANNPAMIVDFSVVETEDDDYENPDGYDWLWPS